MLSMLITGLPILLGVLVILGLEALDRTRFPVRGISPSYFASVALLFGLFASLVATDAWQRTSKTSLSLATEVSELRSMLRIGEVEAAEGPSIRAAVQSYVSEVRAHELNRSGGGNTLAPPPAGLHALYRIGAVPGAFHGNISVSNSFMGALETVGAARLQRLDLAKNQIPPRHMVILFLMGLLTQIAIGFSHGGNRVAMVYSVMLFSIAFSGAIYFIRAFDDPYSAGYNASFAELAEVV